MSSTLFLGIVLLRILLISYHQERQHAHSRNLHRYRKSLPPARKYIYQRRIPRYALIPVAKSSWRKVYTSRDAQAMITLTGYDADAFDYLCHESSFYFDNYSPFIDKNGFIVQKRTDRGRPRMVRLEDCLGLTLAWTRTRGSLVVLQLIFGMTMTNLDVYLRFGKRIILECLRFNDFAQIRVPPPEKIEFYKQTISRRHLHLKDVWCVMDGLKLSLQASGNQHIQRRFYNGWTHGHYVSNVFCFCPDGTIAIAFFNVPGSMHDSQIAHFGGIYRKLEKVYLETGGKCVADSAFARTNREYLIKSSQDCFDVKADTRNECEQLILESVDATSLRQSAEWGMRALKASCPRLHDCFVYEERGERVITLEMILKLYNLRAHLVDINQIKNVYLPNLDLDANRAMIGIKWRRIA